MIPPSHRRPQSTWRPLSLAGVAGLLAATLAAILAPPHPALAQQETDGEDDRFRLEDVFDLEWADDPRISPDGSRIVYERNSMDIMEDRRRSDLWIVDFGGSDHRALTAGDRDDRSPRWSPTGDRIVYLSSEAGGDDESSTEIRLRWMDTGKEAVLATVRESPSGLSWSPAGTRIAFTMFVPSPEDSGFATMPAKPEGAEWGPEPEVIDEIPYRSDGRGYLEEGHRHVFVLPAEGGTPRQVTSGPYDHEGTPAWTPAGDHLIVAGNRHEDAVFEPLDTEIYEVALGDGSIRALTDRYGPDSDPAVSPDGSTIAYTGFDDRHQGYQVTKLYVMNRDGSGRRVLTADLDRDVEDPVWGGESRRIYFQFDDQGNTRLAQMIVDGRVETVAGDVGGLSLGRPYPGGTFSASRDGRLAYTHSEPDHPADVAVAAWNITGIRRLTRLNEDLLDHKELGAVEEIRYESSHDGRRIQGWIVTPPGFDPSREYPLLLEIHGGPFANYGDRFAAEIQLYAAAGYVVFYANPRGSTSYGEEFGNLIHHAYPGHDYDDLMSGVDAVIERGYVDEDRLFVTGGSGGGVLSAWIVGKTDRFRAAAVQKPVINWYSFALTSDLIPFFYKYWFPGPPWEHRDHYLDRSPIALVGNVSTPTMVITGAEDYRTPMAETEQYYAALKLRKVPTAMVRIPDASHGIAGKPSNLAAKVAHVLGWFAKHGGPTP